MPLSPQEQSKWLALIDSLAEAAKREHYSCEDCWYSCPLSENGSCNSQYPKGKCNCGADDHNHKVTELAEALKAVAMSRVIICKACECVIDADGCGCDPHDA